MSQRKTKNILFRMKIEGTGIVNFDSADARWNVKNYGNPASLAPYNNDNIKVAKSTYTFTGKYDEEGKPIVKRNLKISSDCLRHAIFENDYDVCNGRLMKNDALLATFISSPAALLRGYMNASEDCTIKAKSAFTISPAIEDGSAIIVPEAGSTSGDKSETSFFYTETAGNTSYSAKGAISLKQLEFLSCDDFFERRGVKNSWVETEDGLLNKAFEVRYGRVPYELGIYTAMSKTLTNHIGEYGLHFDDDFRKMLVAELLKRMLSISISRSGAYAKISELEVKPVYDVLTDTFDNGDGWQELADEKDIQKFIESISFETFFEKADNDAQQVMNELCSGEAERKAARKAKKDEKKNRKSKTTTTEEANNEDDSSDL